MLAYVPQARRPAIAALLAIDVVLGDVLRSTTEPMLGQMRLTWWHDALTGLDNAPAPAQPVLADAAAAILPAGVTGTDLASMVEGWEPLLEAEIGVDALEAHARERGGRLFALAAAILGPVGGFDVAVAGQGWALADLSRQLSDDPTAGRVAEMARDRIRLSLARQWPKPLRALAIMAQLAADDLANGRRPGAPGRVARAAWRGLTGR